MDIKKTVQRQLVGYIVQRNIFCPVTGEVLDVRTCKWLVDKDGDPAYVISPGAYEKVLAGREAVEEELNKRGLFFPED